jgi:type III secretion protein U
MSGEKTEEPTQKKLDDARKKGQNAKSQDVNAAASLVGLLICLIVTGDSMFDQLSNSMQLALRQGVLVKSNSELFAVMTELLKAGFIAILPLVATSVAIGFVASFGQVGFNLSFEPLSPNFDKLNPASGLKKMFSVRSIIDFLKMLAKAVALGAVLWVLIVGLIPLLVGATYFDPAGVGVLAWKSMLKLLAAGCVVFIVIGPVDFGLQIWLFKRDQKMSKDEIKREHKESEGDPMVKGKRKQRARELAKRRMAQAVSTADVVIVNPTHYSVALRYDESKDRAPVVGAKGVDESAAKIREIARASGVPVMSRPPLARALHKHVKEGAPIPANLFKAVAEVLAYVYRIKRGGAA